MNNLGILGIVVLAIGLGALALGAAAGGGGQHTEKAKDGKEKVMVGPFEVTGVSPKRPDKVFHTDAEWRELLTADQYDILRKEGTEPRFCEGTLGKDKHGVYECAACGLPLFKAGDKFDSGTGWPSFFQPIAKDSVWMRMDYSLAGMPRAEVLCARCDSHLGHAFEDGPKDKTGVRFCMNSKALKFVPDKPGKSDDGKG